MTPSGRAPSALVGQAGEEDVPLEDADVHSVAAQVLSPRCGAGVVVGAHVLAEHERRDADGLVERAGVSDPRPDGARLRPDGDEHFVLVPVEVLGELAAPVLDLLRGHAGGQRDVDFDAAASELDPGEHGRADAAHVLDGLA
jgi:hypothetical protein